MPHSFQTSTNTVFISSSQVPTLSPVHPYNLQYCLSNLSPQAPTLTRTNTVPNSILMNSNTVPSLKPHHCLHSISSLHPVDLLDQCSTIMDCTVQLWYFPSQQIQIPSRIPIYLYHIPAYYVCTSLLCQIK